MNAVNLQAFAHQLITDLELSPGKTSTARELIEKASLKLDAIRPDALSPEARRAHARLALNVGVLRNAGAEAASEAFKAAIAATEAKVPSPFMTGVNAAIARQMKLQPVYTVGGEYFPTEDAAKTRALGIAAVQAFTDMRALLGDQDYADFVSGKAYLQHAPKDVAAARRNLLALAQKYFGEDAHAALTDLLAGGPLREAAEPLKYAANRLLRTTADGKEYPNFYSRQHPPEGRRPIDAKPSTLSLAIPTTGVPEPHPWHLSSSGRPVSLNDQVGLHAEALALTRLKELLAAGPLDATYGPIFGERVRDTILALHGEAIAKAFEDKQWSNVFTGLRDEPIAKYVKAYVEWAEADTLAKFDSVTQGSAPALKVRVILEQVEATTGSIAHFQYEPLRQNLLAIEAGASLAHYVRAETTDFGFYQLATWARETRQRLEKRQADADANAASFRFHDRY